MPSIPAKAAERIKASLKRFQPILQSAKARDVNESDTVVIVTDMLEHIFGYDKYTEITSEHAVRGTYCDLAIKIEGELQFLLEVKAIGHDLKDQHVKQAIDYAANQGIEWVGLTNGIEWRVYKIGFVKPISFDLVVCLNLPEISPRKEEDIELMGLLAKEGWQKANLEHHHTVQKVVNKFTFGAVLLSEPVTDVIRKQLRRISTDIKITNEEIVLLLQNEVIKRDVLEGDKAQQAQRQVSRAGKKLLRKVKEAEEEKENAEIPPETSEVAATGA